MVSVGELLKKEREKRGLTLRQIEKEIKTREQFLKAVEEENWSFFPSKIYIIGIIKNYAKVLGLDSHKLIAFFRREYKKQEDIGFKTRVNSNYLKPQTKKVVFLGLSLFFILFAGYFFFQVKQFLSPPKVTIISPKTDRFRSVEKITIAGKTEKEASIIIYGEKVYPNKEGIFEYSFPLKPGKNQLLVEITGANGKKTIFKKDYFKE